MVDDLVGRLSHCAAEGRSASLRSEEFRRRLASGEFDSVLNRRTQARSPLGWALFYGAPLQAAELVRRGSELAEATDPTRHHTVRAPFDDWAAAFAGRTASGWLKPFDSPGVGPDAWKAFFQAIRDELPDLRRAAAAFNLPDWVSRTIEEAEIFSACPAPAQPRRKPL